MMYHFGNKYGDTIINIINKTLSFSINLILRLLYILNNGVTENQSKQYYLILKNFPNYIKMNINGVNKKLIKEHHKYFVLIIIQTISLRDIWKFSIG